MTGTGFKRIATATAAPSGSGMLIPRSGTSNGGEYGADITNDLRTFAATREPVAYRVTFTIAHDIFDNWFRLSKSETDEESEANNTLNKTVQAALKKVNAKREVTIAAIYEHVYGWSIIVKGYVDRAADLSAPVQDAKELRELKAYAPTQITKVDEVKTEDDPRYGLPEYYHIKRVGLAKDLKVHYTRVIHCATRLLDHDWKGKSVLDPIWDDLTVLRNIRWGMGQTMYRYGSGFPDITFTGAELDDINTWEASGAFADINNKTYFAHSDKQTIEFKGLQGKSLDPMNYYLPPMEHISAGTGVPLAILRGVQAGALTGSEVNQSEYYGLISDEQTAWEPIITQIIEAATAETDSELNFFWNGGFELDELKKADIALKEAQRLQIMGAWYTRNELRKMQDPHAADLSEEQGGDKLLTESLNPPPTFGQQQNQNKGELPEQFQEQVKQGDASYLVTAINRRSTSG